MTRKLKNKETMIRTINISSLTYKQWSNDEFTPKKLQMYRGDLTHLMLAEHER